MTLDDINTIITNKTGLSTNEFSNADRAIYMNIYNNIAVTYIYLSQDSSDFDDPNYGDFPIMTTPFILNQREYPLTQSERVLGVKRVDVTYDGTTYTKATFADSSDFSFGLGNDTNTDSHFSTAHPAVDWKYGSFAIYPLATQAQIDAGAEIRAEWTRAPKQITASDITTGTAEPGFDDTFHPLLAYGTAYEKAQEVGLRNRNELKGMVNELLVLLKQQYGSKELDQKISLTTPLNIIAK